MNCPSTKILNDLIKGDLDNLQVEEVEDHLLSCDSCRNRIIEIEKENVDQLDLEIRAAASNSSIKKYIATNSQKNQIEDYRIEKKIGAGAFGNVYKAVDLNNGEERALKVLHSSKFFDPSSLRRFEKEKNVIARLAHQNIVRSYPSDQENMIVMEYLEGLNLDEYVRVNGPLSVDKAVDIICQVATGLEYAHENGIVHRDIKPSNIFLEQNGNIKILDLGLSKNLNTETGSATSANHITGTLDFLSPEQILSPQKVDQRSDIYSLGCVFYFLLVGKPPFSGSVGEILAAHARDRAPDIREIRPDISVGLSLVLSKMLEKEPARRYQAMSEVAEAIENPKHHTYRHRILSFLLFAFLFFIGVLFFKIILTKNDDPKIPISDVAVAASPIEDDLPEKELALSNPFEEPDIIEDKKEINLVKNGSFEEGNMLRRDDWGHHQVRYHAYFDISTDAKEGQTSVTIESQDGGGGVWRQFVPVEPNTQYTFSVWYKLDNVQKIGDKESGMNICVDSGTYRPPDFGGGYHWQGRGADHGWIFPKPFTGSTNWKKFEQTIETGPADDHIFIGRIPSTVDVFRKVA